jgi:hypothetical protein
MTVYVLGIPGHHSPRDTHMNIAKHMALGTATSKPRNCMTGAG